MVILVVESHVSYQGHEDEMCQNVTEMTSLSPIKQNKH